MSCTLEVRGCSVLPLYHFSGLQNTALFLALVNENRVAIFVSTTDALKICIVQGSESGDRRRYETPGLVKFVSGGVRSDICLSFLFL
jgi:hypothetical protein